MLVEKPFAHPEAIGLCTTAVRAVLISSGVMDTPLADAGNIACSEK